MKVLGTSKELFSSPLVKVNVIGGKIRKRQKQPEDFSCSYLNCSPRRDLRKTPISAASSQTWKEDWGGG